MRTGLLAAVFTLTAPALGQPAIGDRSPDLCIEQLLNAPAGSEATLDALRGKLVVLEFWATWCGPCVGAIPHVNKLHDAYKDRVVFISVTDEDRETVETFQQNDPAIRGWIGLDTDRSLFKAYNVRAIPTTIVLDAEGRFVARTNPAVLNEARLDAYLEGERQAPRPSPRSEGDADATNTLRFRDPMVPGVDPYHPSDKPSRAVFILRDTFENTRSMFASRGDSVSAVNTSAGSILHSLYRLPSSRIDLSAVPNEPRYDLICDGIEPETALALALRSLGLEEHREHRVLNGYRLIEAKAGLRNTTTLEEGGMGYRTDGSSVQLSATSMSAASLATWLEDRLDASVQAGIDPAIRFRIDLELPVPTTPEIAEPAIAAAIGLTFEPANTEAEVVVIRPRASEP